mgnify:CR=1 FL=1
MYWLIIPAVLVIVILILLIRTFLFKPKEAPAADESAVEFDRDKAVSNLQTLIRFKTVSNHDHALEDDAQFEGLIAKLPELYPNVFRVCTLDYDKLSRAMDPLKSLFSLKLEVRRKSPVLSRRKEAR